MSLRRLLSTISDLIPAFPLAGREADLAKLNPQKFYVENVRSVLGVSSKIARRFCDTAVRQGVFQQLIEVRCPDGAVAATAVTESDLPASVHCWTERNGHFEEDQLATKDLERVVFYRLNE